MIIMISQDDKINMFGKSKLVFKFFNNCLSFVLETPSDKYYLQDNINLHCIYLLNNGKSKTIYCPFFQSKVFIHI